LGRSAEELAAAAAALESAILARCPTAVLELADDVSRAGGGSLPLVDIPTRVVRVRLPGLSAVELAERLRLGEPAVVARVQDGAVILDPRTLLPGEDQALAGAIGTLVLPPA